MGFYLLWHQSVWNFFNTVKVRYSTVDFVINSFIFFLLDFILKYIILL